MEPKNFPRFFREDGSFSSRFFERRGFLLLAGDTTPRLLIFEAPPYHRFNRAVLVKMYTFQQNLELRVMPSYLFFNHNQWP